VAVSRPIAKRSTAPGGQASAARALVQPHTAMITAPPTDLDDIAKRLGVREVISAEIHADGELRRRGDRYTIVVSSNQGAARRRFTLAHELAHVIVKRSRSQTASGRELERLCDDMAAELLMPASMFRVEAGPRPDAGRIQRLATRYRTSLAATAMRCAELTTISAFEVLDGGVLWQRRISKPLTRTLVRSISPSVRRTGTFETTFEVEEHNGHRRLQVIGLGSGRSLWLLVPRTVAERVVQPLLISQRIAVR
jgi:Zn-dependent peptidase ImmA (M78 family)